MMDDWADKLFKHKSLIQVFWASRQNISKPAFNRIIFWVVCLSVGSFFWHLNQSSSVTVQQTANWLHTWADVGFQLSVGILGFLVAGFAIFTGITSKSTFLIAAKTPHKTPSGKETELSQLQFMFFNFLNVFTNYLGFLVFCLIISLGFANNGPLQLYHTVFEDVPNETIQAFNLLMAVIFIGWFTSAVLRLKSFIWNMYQTIIFAIILENED